MKVGHFYEDLHVGDILEHDLERSVTHAENKLVEDLTAYIHPLHSDENFAKNTEFGNITLNGIATFSMIYGMSSLQLSTHAIANLEWKNVMFINPVFMGDKLRAKSEILMKRESKSRPTQGIIHIKTIGLNQINNIVISFERVYLIKKCRDL